MVQGSRNEIGMATNLERRNRSDPAPILSLSLAVLLTVSLGCGTLLHGRHQEIRITSNPAGAEIRVLPGNTTGQTPVALQLRRTEPRHGIQFRLDGYVTQRQFVSREVSWGPQIIHILLIPSGLAGTLIDAMTGGLYRLKPDHIHADLVAEPPPPGASESETADPNDPAGSAVSGDDTPEYDSLDPYAPREVPQRAPSPERPQD